MRQRSNATNSAAAGALVPVVAALATFLVFSGALRNEFLNWDDPKNFLQNPHYRGLGWPQLRWMFTSSLQLGHYMPLTWLTFGADFALWGMNPYGYHLTNLLLHAANAAVFYFVARRLLALSEPPGETASRTGLDLFAALSALLFALHPLRVESVAWVTERRDVLSGFFCLLSILFYLKAGDRAESSKYPRRLALSVVFYAFSLLSKISAITLPFALAALDVYPAGRLPGNPRLWFTAETRRVWLEKLPFVLLALPAGLLGISGQNHIGMLRPLARWGAAERVSVALYGAAFYVWKTLAPWNLSPFYPLPSKIDPFAAPFLLSGLVVFAISAVAIAARRKHPAILAVWAWYLILFLPISGLTQSGAQIAADRYTYLPCLGFALLAAGALTRLRARRTASVLAALLLGTLSRLTWRQVEVWRDSESLWRHALCVDGDVPLAHVNLGAVLMQRPEKADEAAREFERALQPSPGSSASADPAGVALAHFDLGRLLEARGKTDEAILELKQALQASPGLPEALNTDLAGVAFAHLNLGRLLETRGKTDEAIRLYELALREMPEFADARNNLGFALAGQGKMEEAIRQYQLAIKEMPEFRRAHLNLGSALWKLGKIDEAGAQFRATLAIPAPDDSGEEKGVTLSALIDVGSYELTRGRAAEAEARYREALRLDPGSALARAGLDSALADYWLR